MRVWLGIVGFFTATLVQGHAAGGSAVEEFPFQLREGLLWVQVHSPQTTEPLNFLLDSGAGVSVINLGTVQRLGLSLGKRVNVQGVGANTVGYWPQHLSAATGRIPLPEDYLAVDLSNLSGACKSSVDGLIGADFFRGRAVQIDFVNRKIRLLAPGRPAAAGQEVLPLKRRSGALQIPVRINRGATQWLRLDTGCASSLQWVTSARLPQTQARRLAIGLTGISVPEAQTTVQLGATSFESVPTGLHDKPIFPGEAGLLGNGLLARFSSVTIDAPSGRVLLQKGF